MAASITATSQSWTRYLNCTRNTLVLRCSQSGAVQEANPFAQRLLGRHDPLAGKALPTLLRRADQAPLHLGTLLADEDATPLVLVAESTGKILQGFFFLEGDSFLLIADVIGDGNEAAEQLGTMANEISDITRSLRQRNQELEEANRRITELCRTDALTGLANRRYLLERLDPLISLTQRHHLPLALVMADLDHFKHINDSLGHEAGDRVLQAFANLLRTQCRREDLPCRFGGEEFMVLLPQTSATDGVVLAERVRKQFAEQSPMGGGTACTASFGVAPIHEHDTALSFIARVDSALYAAKAQGRNCTVAT